MWGLTSLISRIPNHSTMAKPILKPVRTAFSKAKEYMPSILSDYLARMENHGDYAVLRSQNGASPSPSMVNDACPFLSALRIRLGGTIILKPFEDELNNIVTGDAVHMAYLTLLREWNPGWIILTNVYYQTAIEDLTIGFSPDALMAYGGEWHLVEVKTGRLRTSAVIQLALYWLLLKDLYNIKGAWLVTQNAVIPVNEADLTKASRQGIEYLRSVKAILDSWSGELPGFTVKGNCPCHYARICPLWQGMKAYLESPPEGA